MRLVLFFAALTLAVGCATPKAASTDDPAPAEAAAPAEAPTCETLDACVLTCPEGTTLDKDAEARVAACKTAEGVKHGPIVAWYPNGQMMLRGEKRDGKGHGAWTNWHDNGQPSGESVWDNDTWVSGTCWDAEGNVKEPATCWPPPAEGGS